ncbi:hypothetical protein D3C72_1847580 [compost metagenome]
MRLCSSAVGAPSISLVRNTAVPGTNVGFFLARLSTRNCSGTSSRRVFSDRRCRPAIQLHMTSATSAATAAGTQPPWNSLAALAAKNPPSMKAKMMPKAMTAAGCHFQLRHITTTSSDSVTIITPDTAMP